MIVLCLLMTLLFESAVLLVLRGRSPLTYLFLAAVNVSTNLTANLLLFAVAPTGRAYILFVAVAEILIVTVEAVLLSLFTRSCRKGILYAVLCNAVSYAAGTLILHFIL